MYHSLAERAAHGGSATPDLLWPPLYSWLLSPGARLGGNWPIVVALAQVALLALTAVGFGMVLARITGSTRAGVAGEALMLVDPHLGAYAHYLWPEVLYIAELMLLLWLVVAKPGRQAWWVGAGITIAVAVVTKNVLGPYLLVGLAPLALDVGPRRALTYGAGIALVALTLLAPVLWHNGRTHGAFVVSDSSRFASLVGLTSTGRRSAVDDGAGPAFLAYQASALRFDARQRILTQQINARVSERGVMPLVRAQWSRQYFRLLDARTVLTEQLSGGPYQARGVGYARPGAWLSAWLRAWNGAVYAFVLGAAGIGICATPLRGRPWLAYLFGVLAYGLLLFFIVEARSRYRLPLMLPLWTGAALTVSGSVPLNPRWRVVAGGLVSAVLLAFAFGADALP